MTGRVIHTGQVVIDLTLRIEALPEPGGDVFADEAGMGLGGGYNVLVAARRLGVETLFAGTLGRGPFSQAADAGLAAIGAVHVGARVDGDLGYCVAMTDARAERTFVSAAGAETRDPLDAFDRLEVGAEDVVYVSGYSLAHAANTAALERLVRRLVGSAGRTGDGGGDRSSGGARGGGGATGGRPGAVLFDVSPMVGTASMESLEMVGALDPIWSLNEREAGILAARLGLDAPDGDRAATAEALARRLGLVLVRAGASGSWFVSDDGLIRTPSVPVKPVDTNGAGDAHSGVLAAALARGVALPVALRWANVAGALSTTRRGPATCPTEKEIMVLA
ncbi:PfkB family carbohydrate kinase [uncultured Actinomyces sp.]|uniref:PfkB family carbohydrate kinase n=1 Tax=uncultured Actinomyces sp. TaxID=249061 RepID=UPI0028890DDA|nr:PfkB family carbohydrate kinase [uncultured Actinomyces sp.]